MAKFANIKNELGEYICEIMGVNSDFVKSINIDLEADKIAEITIKMYCDDKINGQLIKAIDNFLPISEEAINDAICWNCTYHGDYDGVCSICPLNHKLIAKAIMNLHGEE